GNVSDKETITGDTTAPDAPVVDGFTNNDDNSTTVTGTAEAGSTVEVTDPVTGKVVGSDTADGDGNFKVVVEGGLEDAKDYEVTAKDPAGNVSDKETITGDTTAPDAPVVDGFTNNDDNSTTVTGTAEAGSTVEVTDPVTGKVVGSDTADGDGNFKVVVEGGLEDAKDYEVTAKDPAGNVSDKETITGDTTA
ncbi:Ig-like domain-containing protein, partial [Thiopseudomonas alkaliphila]|uniref:Ig-like domain-containing protein n=1 Tax=Thiopseudomonas alkaliphila TaxID=1697053 RepID=UPI0025764CF7